MNTILKEFTIYGIQNNETISTSRWYSYYQKEGDLLIGGSLIFNSDEFDSNSTLTIRIDYTIKYRYRAAESFSYSEDFDSLTII